jgi:ABC-type amino acid transport substrate-binding protein
MNDRDRLDERWLRGLDDVQLEGLRYDLRRSGDVRAEHAAEHLLVRGIAHVERVAVELGALRGLDAEQVTAATVDASVQLQMRLAREEKLPAVEVLAGRLARERADAMAPVPPTLPRMTARPPRLRTVERALGEALTDGRLKPNQGTNS